MTKLLPTLILLLSACAADAPDAAVRWDAGVRPVAAPGSDPAWSARVDAAVGAWEASLRAAGCATDPFDGSAGTAPVELVTQDVMVARTGSSAYIGHTTHEGILVEGTADDLAHYPTYAKRTLAHELGHALGLVHVSPEVDPGSVMHPVDDRVDAPDDADVAEAAANCD